MEVLTARAYTQWLGLAKNFHSLWLKGVPAMGQITIIVKERSQKSEPEKGSVTHPKLWNEPINKVTVEMRTWLNESKLGRRAWSRPKWKILDLLWEKWKSALRWFLYRTNCIHWGHKCWFEWQHGSGFVAHACSLSSGYWGRGITWAQAFKTTWIS